jgi:hypothetical protein
MRTAVLTTAIVIAALAASAQFALVPWFARGAYLLRSTSLYSSSERQQADAVFRRYRREAEPEDPVVASPMLFRYAHDRNLFWLDRMYGRPKPIWILSDGTSNYGYKNLRIEDETLVDHRGRRMLCIEDYTLVDRRGRFMLLRKRE